MQTLFIANLLFISCLTFTNLLITTVKKTQINSKNTLVSEAKVIFKFQYNDQQERLDALGNPSVMPKDHAALSPKFNAMSAHYFELAENKYTALGKGQVLYHAPETKVGGNTAIEFDKSTLVKHGETALTVPIKSIKAGNYDYLRVSLAYQNYDVKLRAKNIDLEGTLASFIGYNTYIAKTKIKNQELTVNANKKQGFWACETIYAVRSGQAPRTTVPNPLFATSPVPAGSCVVTAGFDKSLTITGNETEDIVIIVSLSTNKSFEWKDLNKNGIWEPLDGENVVDMGIRGMKLFRP
jgi:hypothetical protein